MKKKKAAKKPSSTTLGEKQDEVFAVEAANKKKNGWSSEQILETEILLLKLMEENNAVTGNRITRVALRDKANAFISNHALIDHVLKISVDKVAPGDKFRFRRSYNSAGHQVYWLEDSHLLEDSMANDLRCLTQEISNVKRDFVSKKDLEAVIERIPKMRKEMEDLILQIKKYPSQTTDDADEVNLKVVDPDLYKKIVALASGVEIGMETTKMEATSTESGADAEKPPPREGKTAKIERLKSGFTLSRPHSTLLWPDYTCQVEDHLQVPTPPSVNSLTPPQLPYLTHHNHNHNHNLSSPVSHPQTNIVGIPTDLSTTNHSNLLSSGMKNDHSWEAYEQVFLSVCKKRRCSLSSGSLGASSSCVSNIATPAGSAAATNNCSDIVLA